MIALDELMRICAPKEVFAWTGRDAILYALAIGLGGDPLDRRERRFVYEEGLCVVPSFATAAAWGSNPPIRAAGIDYTRLVHASQSIELHRPLPPAASVRAYGGMTGAIDKGDKGALIDAEVVLRDAATGEPYVTNRVTWLARGDGNFGGPVGGATEPLAMPARPPDRRIVYATRPDQAVLYRLLGDRNPLHIDPEVARRAGFARPILHGLCTFGFTCRAVLETMCDMDPARLRSHSARFSAPVLPGETLAIELWRDGMDVSFEASVIERSTKAISGGRAVLV